MEVTPPADFDVSNEQNNKNEWIVRLIQIERT